MLTTQQTNANRAVAAYNALQKYFYVPDGTPLYRETYPWSGGNKYAFVWPFSRALVGTLALAGVPTNLTGGTSYVSAVQDRFTGLANYWDAFARLPAYDSYVVSQGGGDRYHDNAWVSLAFIQQYRMGLSTSVDRAEQLFTYAQSGWDPNPADPDVGGIFGSSRVPDLDSPITTAARVQPPAPPSWAFTCICSPGSPRTAATAR